MWLLSFDGYSITTIDRWMEQFGSQFSWPSVTEQPTQVAPIHPQWCVPTNPPSELEASWIIDVFKAGSIALIRQFTLLLRRVWNAATIPSRWSESFLFSWKVTKVNFEAVRGISRNPIACKLLSIIILHIVSTAPEEQTHGEQAGFHRPTVVVVIDICDAFDSVDRNG